MNELDIGFINDPEWKKERDSLWGPIEQSLKTDLRKIQLTALKRYYFTGELSEHYKISDSALLYYFPLYTSAGWDYVFQYLVKDPSAFEYDFYYSIHDRSRLMPSMKEQLQYFDYFHPVIYQPNIRSRVPIGADGKIVEIQVDKLKLFCFLASQLITFVERNESALCYYRRDYFFSMLPFISPEESHGENTRTYTFLRRFMRQACNYSPKVEFTDPDKKPQKFLKEFAGKLDTLDLDSSVKELWNEVKQEKGVV